MFSYLKTHPFAVEAFFENSLVLTFAVPKEELEPLLPECLELDIYNSKWAFIAVAMVETKGLKPKGFPKFFGNSFFLTGYRVFVRYTNSEGKKLRGLYILKSETDKKKMEWLGNFFTHYKYSTIDIKRNFQGQNSEIMSHKADFKVILSGSEEDIALPTGSPFPDWKTARRYAGPLPFTFTYLPESSEVLIIEGVRQNWVPKPIKIVDYYFSYFNSLGLRNQILANAFIIRNIPYYWKKGRLDRWEK